MPRVPAQSYGGGCGADLMLSSVSESEAWIQNFATLYDIVWLLLAAGHRSPVIGGHGRVSYWHKFYSVGFSNNDINRCSHHESEMNNQLKWFKIEEKLQQSKKFNTNSGQQEMRSAPEWMVVTMGWDGQQCDRGSSLHSADSRKYNTQHHLHIPSDDTTPVPAWQLRPPWLMCDVLHTNICMLRILWRSPNINNLKEFVSRNHLHFCIIFYSGSCH